MTSPLPDFLAAQTNYRVDFSQEVAAPNRLRRDAEVRRERQPLGSTPLTIGIIGQAFSGKRGLLNALLFDGAPLLPNVVTPQSVNLTRIVHGERPKLTVHYYTPEDWAALERLAASPDAGMEAEVARSITRLAQQAGIDIGACLARRTETVEAGTLEELWGRIDDYVGVHGRYSALVESAEFALPLDALLGIEVVCTPGINDPVISRTQKARDCMARCDVVFFLSCMGWFLDEIDVGLIGAQLPDKGVKRLVIVVTKFGSAVIDEIYCGPSQIGSSLAGSLLTASSLIAAERSLTDRLTRRAIEVFERIAAQCEQSGYTDLATLLRASATPIFICSNAHALATQPPEHWSRSQRWMHDEFADLPEEVWSGPLPTPADWQRLAGFDALYDALPLRR